VKTLGRHVLTEFYGCDSAILNDVDLIRTCMERATELAGATIVQSVFHLFNPHGVSGVVVIAESHLAIHTWPEYGFAAIDLFTCGDEVDPWKAYLFLKEALRAEHVSTMEMKRGQLDLLDAEITHKPAACRAMQAGAAG
jgi:S-adenosylmethionine decarboxylase proenzyme